MNVDQMMQQFKTDTELKAYAEAQYMTILEMSKKIQKLEEDNLHLKKMLEKSVPILEEDKKDLLIFPAGTTNEEIICSIQLGKLKELSMERELTLEETKKTEIYSKILLSLRNKTDDSKKQAPTEALSTADLLNLVSSLDKMADESK